MLALACTAIFSSRICRILTAAAVSLWMLPASGLEAPAAERAARLVEDAWKEGGYPSISYGIVAGDQLVQAGAFGAADRKGPRPASADTIYLIGSVTKVFTATLMASMRDRGEVRLDDPVAKYLPPGTSLPSDPRGAPAMTLRHLATHTSGLPRLPVNLTPAGMDPYGGFTIEALWSGLKDTRLQSPVGWEYSYSNLGAGLLGQALARAARKPYARLLEDEILQPLGMRRSWMEVPKAERGAVAVGYTEGDTAIEAARWDLGSLGPAGGLASTVGDLAKFLSLQLRAGEPGVRPVAGGTLRELHTPQRLIDGWKRAVALGWHVSPSRDCGDIVWHNGALAGYTSYVGFSPRFGVGVIVLANCGKSVDGIGRPLLSEAVKSLGREKMPEASADLVRIAGALSPCFAAEPPDRLADLFHPLFLAEIPIAKLKPLFRSVHAANGACEGADVKPGADPFHASIEFRFAGGKKVAADLAVDAGAHPKIIYFLIKGGSGGK